jgi:uncharacterized protein YqgC (DUF456 family)
MNQGSLSEPATVAENVGSCLAAGSALGSVIGLVLEMPFVGLVVGGALGVAVGWVFRFAGNPEAAKKARRAG